MSALVSGRLAPAVPPPFRIRLHHDDLLAGPPPGSAGEERCDAVIVPSHAYPERLDFVVDLAASLECLLLVLCTQGRLPAVTGVLAGHDVRPPAAVLALPHGGGMPRDGGLPPLELSAPAEVGARARSYRDLSLKRNTGLAVARMAGWRNVLLVDDDIRGLPASAVRRAFGWLTAPDGPWVASWKATRFPDNSAVCHAGREAGLDQGVFVGSGAMAVRLDDETPLFPPVYNEDWCFLFDHRTERRVVLAGEVTQLAYNPYDPAVNRGENEEFGDVLGEGLFHLLHCGLDASPAATETYWPDVLAARRAFILDIRQRLDRTGTDVEPRRRAEMVACLDQALKQHAPDMPRRLASFVQAWIADREAWRSWYTSLPVLSDDVAAAVRLLGWPPEQFALLPRRSS
jgi:hypothetical protein